MTQKYTSQATLAVVVSLSIIMISLSTLVASITYNHYENQNTAIKATQALLLADSALENALLRLQRNSGYTGETFTVPTGSVTVTVTNTGTTTRTITVSTTSSSSIPVKRSLSINMTITGQENPLRDMAIFSGEDVKLIKANSMLVGNLWTNDNVTIDDNTIVRGNVYAAGQGNISNSVVKSTGRVEDNPATTEVEGNLYSIDRIRVNTGGFVQNIAESKVSVDITSGGQVGQAIVNPSLTIGTIPVPTFKFSDMRTLAQAAGTYYTSPSQFLNFLSLSGNVLTGGIHYIGSTSSLNFASGTTFDITGTIISDGDINIYSTSYTHNAADDYPALASKRNISFLDQSNCDCTATVNGVIFADRDVTLKHDQYTGGQPYAIQVTGAIWAGDQTSVEDSSILTFDSAVAEDVQGFNFTTDFLPPGTDNIIDVTTWSIN